MSKKPDIPQLGFPIIETHCHLDYLKEVTVSEALDAAIDVGVEKVITIAVSAENLSVVRGLVKEHDVLYGTQGIHPHDAEGYSAQVAKEIMSHINDPDIVAVGEIGLDYFYDHADRSKQRAAFAEQLQIAVDNDKPVVIHTREADEDTQDILKDFAPYLKRKGVIHSFTSGIALAEYCLSEGFCLGFNGICTFKKAENVREVVAITPLDQILLETDAPYLTPVPYRGRENAPKYLPFIAEHVASIKNCDVGTLLQQVYQNSQNVFFNDKT